MHRRTHMLVRVQPKRCCWSFVPDSNAPKCCRKKWIIIHLLQIFSLLWAQLLIVKALLFIIIDIIVLAVIASIIVFTTSVASTIIALMSVTTTTLFLSLLFMLLHPISNISACTIVILTLLLKLPVPTMTQKKVLASWDNYECIFSFTMLFAVPKWLFEQLRHLFISY